MSQLLKQIVDQTQADLEVRRASAPDLRADPKVLRHTFGQALRVDELSLIAEVKPRSPSKGHLLDRSQVPELVEIYDKHAHAMSVLIDSPFFNGGLDLLQQVRTRTTKPLLAKGFILDSYQIHEARIYGADAILLIVRILDDEKLNSLLKCASDLGLDALVEVHTDEELERALQAQAPIVGVNARDLDTLKIDLEAAYARLNRIPSNIVRVAESGVETPEQVARIRGFADAALIGTGFLQAEDIEAKMEQLGW